MADKSQVPKRGKSQRWWKRKNTASGDEKEDRSLSLPQSGKTSSKGASRTNTAAFMALLDKEASSLKKNEIRAIQLQCKKTMAQQRQLLEELDIRASQLEQLEENFRTVSDGTKVIATRAMQQEQQMAEMKDALDLTTRQLELYRGNIHNEKVHSIVLPMHLRAGFSDFLARLLSYQKGHFEKALQSYVDNIQSDQLPPQVSKEQLRENMAAIGNALTQDYVSELELRLNGTFDAQPTEIIPANSKKKKFQETMMSRSADQASETVVSPPILEERGVSRDEEAVPALHSRPTVDMDVMSSPQSMLANPEVTPRQTGVDPKAFYNLHASRTSTVHFSMERLSHAILPGLGSPGSDGSPNGALNGLGSMDHDTAHPNAGSGSLGTVIHEDREDDDDRSLSNSEDLSEDEKVKLDLEDEETKEMLSQMLNLTQQHMASQGDGSDGVGDMWNTFMSLKQSMNRPTFAPKVYKVEDNFLGFVALRDMLDAFPADLAKRIFEEQLANPNDRIRDVIVQKGCWPVIRYSNNRHSAVPFAQFDFAAMVDILGEYLGISPDSALIESLDPQNSTGYRLHQLTAIVKSRDDSPKTVSAINFTVGRLWTPKLNVIHDAISFWSSLDKPASMLFLGPNTTEKSALCREITRIISERARTALVDTRCCVGGFLDSPLECGTAVRFFVNGIEDQHRVIEQTRSIYPQVVVVDEVQSEKDVEVLTKLQSEGISLIVGTNQHSLQALLVHPVFSQLLPEGDRLTRAKRKRSASIMSPHLVVLELNYNASRLKVYKNIPAAVEAIKGRKEPKCETVRLRWGQFGDVKTYTRAGGHNREMSNVMEILMHQTMMSRNASPAPGGSAGGHSVQSMHSVQPSFSHSNPSINRSRISISESDRL